MSDEPSVNDVAELLTASATWGEVNLLEDYLGNGADPNQRNRKGDTSLHVACLYGEIECANTLLTFKADVNAKGAEGKTPLHKAVMGASTLEPSPKLKNKASICANQIDLVKLLVGRGADVKARDDDGATPKDLALYYDFYECAEVLTELADMQEKMEQAAMKQRRVDEFYLSCLEGNLDDLRVLLTILPEYLNQSNKDRMTPLMIAAKAGHVDIVDYLIERGAEPSRTRDRVARTALHYASEKGHVAVVKKLFEKLPKLLQYDDSQDGTSLHLAAREGHTEVVRVFLEAAAQVEGLRTPCKTPNHLASDSSTLEYVDKIPPESFINVRCQSPQDNRTPLHEAVIGGHTETVELLVGWLKEHPPERKSFFQSTGTSPATTPSQNQLHPPGTPHTPVTPTSMNRTPSFSSSTGIDMMTTRGRTPLQEAVKQGNIGIADVLLKGGADINAVMRPGLDVTANADLTALVQAALSCDLDMVRYLLKQGATDARLKALTRVLRIQNNDTAVEIAGILLCYNPTVTVDSSLIELRRRSGKDNSQLPMPVTINWASKKLPTVHPSWIPLTLREADLPKSSQYIITQLNLSDNKLTRLPIQVFQLEDLQRLDVSRNKIIELPLLEMQPKSGWACNSLTHFDMSHNEFSSLPIVLFQLPELRELTGNYNNIESVSIEMWSAPRLQKLLLQHNNLQSFPSPVTRRDSGISSVDIPQDLTHTLQNSLSLGNVPISQFSPPSRITMPARHSVQLSHSTSRGRLQTSPGNIGSSILADRRSSLNNPNPLRSRLLDLFSTGIGGDGFEDESELEVFDQKSVEEDAFVLEALDISHNKLTAVPSLLCCLAPKLKRLLIHHNKVKSLGCITDYSLDLELLDASFNELSTAIACAPSRESLRMLPCAQKLLQASVGSELLTPVRCAHRNHRVLKKMGYLKLCNNQLVDVQMFRTVVRECSSSGGGDLTSSMDDSKLHNTDRRSKSITDPLSVAWKDLTKSSAIPRPFDGPKESTGNSSEGSGGGDSSKERRGKEEVLYCLFPQLSTLDIGHNRLKAVPAHIELITTLAVLTISHNVSIDTLPLELSNLEGLWSLEYEGVPLTNPSAEDLDKFRSASDKLLYMRSLLHDAKPNESMKLMLVGLQKQGKTTLLSRLREVNEVDSNTTTFTERVTGGETPSITSSFRPSALLKRFGAREAPLSTVGVDLGLWKYRKDLEPSYKGKKGSKTMRSVTFYTWDFGGQEEYYATHQCFLSFRSLYLVIFNMVDGENGIDNLGPWLHNIQARAPDSPVVIIGTHLDSIKGETEKEKRKKELREYIQEKYQFGCTVSQVREMGLPQIKEVMFVGCPSIGRGEGVADLRMMLWDIAFSLTVPRRKGVGGAKSKLLEQQIPSSYLMLQEAVRRLAVLSQNNTQDTQSMMKEAEFRDATRHIIPNSRELDQAVMFLHDNGILLHYATPALNHLYFIDPQWLCDMLAHVVTVPEVNRFIQRGSGPDAGILKTSVLSHLYKGKLFPQQHRKEYIELLGKFEVALLLDRNRLLVPSMLPKAPSYTVHWFETVFPRPPLTNILSSAFTQMQEDSALSPYSPFTDPLLRQSVPQKFPDSPSLYRTGLLLRRFYFMTYVPSGFWPRLISRFLTSSDFPVTILKAIGFSEEKIREIIPLFISGESCSMVSLQWSYWTTGLELWYQGWSMLRVSEIRLDGTFENCDSSVISGHLPRTEPIEPAVDVDDLSFRVNGQWLSIDQTPSTGLEILIPDYVCPTVLEKEYPVHTVSVTPVESDGEGDESQEELKEEEDDDSYVVPLQETSWMSAQLLVLTVEQIDTLLEDWYPGIGSKDSGKNMYSIPYVNRVVPCPFCVNHSELFTEQRLRTVTVVEQSDLFRPVDSHFSCTESESPTKKPCEPSPKAVRRALLPSLNQAVDSPNTSVNVSRNRLEDGSPPFIEPTSDEFPSQKLIQATRFGFMIESCVAACRGVGRETLVCPAHPSHELHLSSLVPDLVFADLPTHFLINDKLLEQGKFVASGSFGEIYHGAVYPYLSAKDDEGMDVAIKVDKQDNKHFSIDNAAKAYSEIRAEVGILKDLNHENVIQFIGIVLQPLCFILEWAPRGSLHGILTAYNSADARISPWSLVETASQVANGLQYLHYKHVVYYDLKSPNILVFEFPSPEESMQVSLGYRKLPANKFPVLVKIADMGISRKLTPGGVVGYKGTPAFMAPEILSYAGKEACTEKVDVFSFGMFLYELVSLQFPFERQNLMHNQIEKLIIEGDRPPLQNRELNNPLLFLDVLRWAWQQDYHNRPSASQLHEVLSQSLVSHLVNAYPLAPFALPQITASCVVTLPVDVSQTDIAESDTEAALLPIKTPFYVQGDLQEEVWLCSEGCNPDTNAKESVISVVTFQGKANFAVKNFGIGNTSVSCLACVNQTVWAGTVAGQVLLYDSATYFLTFSRYLAVRPDQSLVCIKHVRKLRQVIVVRKDGCFLLFDENLSEHLIPDCSHFDNFINAAQLPVKNVFNARQVLITVEMVTHPKTDQLVMWCGSNNEVLVTLDVSESCLEHFERLQARSYAETSAIDVICKTCVMEVDRDGGGKMVYMWALSHPGRVLYLWDTEKKSHVSSYFCDEYTTEQVSDILSLDSYLYISTSVGTIVVLQLDPNLALFAACDPVSAHTKGINSLLLLSGRVFPRQWLPKLVGRSNAIEYYKDLLDEEEIEDISSRMIGHHSLFLVSIGQGFQTVSGNKVAESSLHSSEVLDSFLLLWLLPR